MKRIFLALLFLLLLSVPAFGATTETITQYGFTWTFSAAKEYGQFINGDYWVVGPVTITSITPNYVPGVEYGWEVNPVPSTTTGFQSGCKGATTLDTSKVPALPYTAQPGTSIVKTAPKPGLVSTDQYCLKTAAVLTVLAAAPAGNGADIFRPPYIGTSKPQYVYANARTDLLPSKNPVGGEPTLVWVRDRFAKPQIELGNNGLLERSLHPSDIMPDYAPSIGRDHITGLLRLFLNDSLADKKAALVNYLQAGIDLYYAMLNGQLWLAGGGHIPGMAVPIAFFAVMLGDSTAQANVAANTRFWEKRYIQPRTGDSSDGIYGLIEGTHAQYWTFLCASGGSENDKRDPYGYIEGGQNQTITINGYSMINWPVWRGQSLAGKLMPSLIPVFNFSRLDNYVTRHAEVGLRLLPDPCAPCSGTYGVNYGPIGGVEGAGCITGSGRFPSRDGTYANFSNSTYDTDWQRAMWEWYSGTTQPEDRLAPTFPGPDIGGLQDCATDPVNVLVYTTTNEPAYCKYSTINDTAYASMTQFTTTGGTTHSSTISRACSTAYTYYVKCQDRSPFLNTNDNANEKVITFTMDVLATGDATPPVLTNPGPNENYSCAAGGGPNTVTLRVTANDETTPITCKYSTTNQAYATMEGTFLTSGGTPAQDVDDHYPESNWVGPGTSTDSWVGGSWGTEDGQSFTSTGGVLDTVQFYLSKAGTGTLAGTMTVKIYDHSGVYGTSSLPNTGSLLATSGTVNASELTATRTLKTLTFSDAARITLVAGTKYFASLAYSGGDATTFVYSGGDTSAPSHGGNNAGNYGGWTAYPATDTIFYVNVTRGGSGDFSQDVSLACGNTYNYYFRCTDGTYPNLTSSTATFTIYPSTPSNITEAESGAEVSPMMAIADAAASGGYYIHSTTLNEGTATISVTPAVAGTYRIKARFYHADGGADSLFLKIGAQDEILWDMNPSSNAAYNNVWREDYVNSRGTGTSDAPQYVPYYVTLTTDAVDFVFRGREKNARLDWFGLELQSIVIPPPFLFNLMIISTGNTYLLGTGGATMKLE